jgi:amidohydrolase
MSTSNPLEKRLDQILKDLEADTLQVRRHLHQYPEVGWEETKTKTFLMDWLREQGLSPQESAGTGVYVDIGSGKHRLLYRADIDALPIQDVKDPKLSRVVSQHPGVMHACGHDLHTAVAAGLARAFYELRDELHTPIRVIFQPAEEVTPSGAAAMIAEGIADETQAAFALHADPTREIGTVGLKTGVLTATSDGFSVEVTGRAGHSARPHLAKDAVLAASEVIRTFYSLIPQNVNPLETAVLSVGMVHGGTAENIIAGHVKLVGTVRTLNPVVRTTMHQRMQEAARHAAAIHNCEATTTFRLGSQSIENHPDLHEWVLSAARDVVGLDRCEMIDTPSTGAEDFGRFSAVTRTYMMRLGVRTPGADVHHLHTPRFDLDERAISVGMRIMGRVMLRAQRAPQ